MDEPYMTYWEYQALYGQYAGTRDPYELKELYEEAVLSLAPLSESGDGSQDKEKE